MNPYIEKLTKYLAENELNYGYGTDSIWEMLYWCYTECNPINNDRIRTGFRAPEECMPGMTLEQNDQLTNLISMLCLEHEKAASTQAFRQEPGWCWNWWSRGTDPTEDNRRGRVSRPGSKA